MVQYEMLQRVPTRAVLRWVSLGEKPFKYLGKVSRFLAGADSGKVKLSGDPNQLAVRGLAIIAGLESGRTRCRLARIHCKVGFPLEAGFPNRIILRTHSQGRPATPGMMKKRQKKRANSFSGGQLAGGWVIPAKFDENHLSQRHEDWRDGDSPRGVSGTDISFCSER
ncbi:hypothetical protein K438DRAFT_1763161 [Mycena galopus ATCC 62051]|nr:hypothetical protein K438DRAFT_1763161 [Mycena galopus ATCC 62051]